LTKTFQPAVGKVADNNFLQTVGFLGSLSRTAETNTRSVQRLAQKLNGVQPEVREEFTVLAGQVAQRAAKTDREARVPQRQTAVSAERTSPIAATSAAAERAIPVQHVE
jgi:hypothetical protein